MATRCPCVRTVAPRCRTGSLFRVCRITDVHEHFPPRHGTWCLGSRIFRATPCIPLWLKCTRSLCRERGHLYEESLRKGGLLPHSTCWVNPASVCKDGNTCDEGPEASGSLVLSSETSLSQTTAWASCTAVEQENRSSFLSAGKTHSPVHLYELCKTSLFHVYHSHQWTTPCITTAGTSGCVTRPGTRRDLTVTHNCHGTAQLRSRSSRTAYTLQQEAPFTSEALPCFRSGNTVGVSGFDSALLKFHNHTVTVRHRLVYYQQQAPAFVSKADYHGTTLKPRLHGNETCLCSHCNTPAPRQLDILCRASLHKGVAQLVEEFRTNRPPSCGHVLQPRYDRYKESGYSFFDLLELKPDFNVDLMDLDARHKKLLKKLHPDTNLTATENERTWNDEHRKQVALAVAVLKCPARRVLHLLQHHLHCLPDGAENAKLERVTDSKLLAEVLELNEALEGVRTRDELNAFEKRIHEILQVDEKALATTFREKDTEGMKLNAQRYMMHAALLDRIKNWSPYGI